MWELMVKGGWIMWPILACSVAAAVLFLERVFHLHRAQIKQEDFLSGIYTIVNRGNTAEAVSICDQTPGPVAHMVRIALLHSDEQPAELKQTINKAGLSEIPRLEKNLGGLLTIAQVTPLLGLMGTVIGLIQVFMAMEQNAPLAEIGDLSGGIWQALVTTAVGICVSVPSFAGYNFLLSRVEAVTLNMEHAAEEIYRFLVYARTPADSSNETL
jgi:biopolymer transport protein ExbB